VAVEVPIPIARILAVKRVHDRSAKQEAAKCPGEYSPKCVFMYRATCIFDDGGWQQPKGKSRMTGQRNRDHSDVVVIGAGLPVWSVGEGYWKAVYR